MFVLKICIKIYLEGPKHRFLRKKIFALPETDKHIWYMVRARRCRDNAFESVYSGVEKATYITRQIWKWLFQPLYCCFQVIRLQYQSLPTPPYRESSAALLNIHDSTLHYVKHTFLLLATSGFRRRILIPSDMKEHGYTWASRKAWLRIKRWSKPRLIRSIAAEQDSLYSAASLHSQLRRKVSYTPVQRTLAAWWSCFPGFMWQCRVVRSMIEHFKTFWAPLGYVYWLCRSQSDDTKWWISRWHGVLYCRSSLMSNEWNPLATHAIDSNPPVISRIQSRSWGVEYTRLKAASYVMPLCAAL